MRKSIILILVTFFVLETSLFGQKIEQITKDENKFVYGNSVKLFLGDSIWVTANIQNNSLTDFILTKGKNDSINSISIKFTYDTRSDVNTHYVGGSALPKTALLTSIKMETEGNVLVREYQFRYLLDFYTHLNEIVEFGSDHKYLNSKVNYLGMSMDKETLTGNLLKTIMNYITSR